MESNVQKLQTHTRLDYPTLESAFPAADPGLRPFGSKVLVQLRTPKKKSAGGIILPNETTETEIWNTQVAKVHALGPVCFCNRETLEPWPEGAWCKVGDFVRVPKYGGDRWWVQTDEDKNEVALFLLVRDLDIAGDVKDPLAVVSFV